MVYCLVKSELGGSRGIGMLRVADMVQKGPAQIAISGSALALDAASAMTRSRRHAICVTDTKEELLTGIITSRDLVAKLGLMPLADRKSALVNHLCTRNPLCATPEWSLDETLSAMSSYGFRHLPVVPSIDNEGIGIPASEAPAAPHVIGLLSVSDIVAASASVLISADTYLRFTTDYPTPLGTQLQILDFLLDGKLYQWLPDSLELTD
jgi:CBS domain-containing protein